MNNDWIIWNGGECPDCDGRWTFALAGPKQHLHAACSGPCGGRMME